MGARHEVSMVSLEKELIFTRLFDAPRELIFKVWTEQEHVEQWWGPTGFSTTTQKMEVKPGGIWRFCMHGPDGRDYENKITFHEIAQPEKLVYAHGGDKETEPVNFHVTVLFEPHGSTGKQTKVTMHMKFPSAAAKNFVVETYGAIEGAHQHLGRLEDYLDSHPNL